MKCPSCGGEMHYEVERMPPEEAPEGWTGEVLECEDCDYKERLTGGHSEKVK